MMLSMRYVSEAGQMRCKTLPGSGSDPGGLAWKTLKGRCTGGVLITCPNHRHLAPFNVKEQPLRVPGGYLKSSHYLRG